ncbi:RNA polymerase sigma24 factor [Alicyclobacillus tengchongensis]|nr:RNA polymerase sigma24 factor [Alicyclobacillus tengchongensis]
MNELSDDMLLSAIVEGRRDAMEELYDRFAGFVYSFAYRAVGNASAAEEIVQDVFVKVWRMADRYDASLGKVSTWLLSIARNAAIDHHRRHRRHELVQIADGVLPEVADDAPTPEWVAEQADIRQRVRQALSQLPLDQKQIVEMMYFRGYTQQEISECLGISLGTVKSRARLAMAKLRERLGSVGMEVEQHGESAL